VPYQHALETEAGQRNVHLYLQGLLSHLPRKNAEDIAMLVDVKRLVLQEFIGTAPWDHRPLVRVLVGEVVARLGEPDGIIAFDPSSFPKRGTHSVGVKRQWCSHRGKVDTCQVGVFLAYAASAGSAPLDRRLYLPEDWADDAARRATCHIPPEVKFQEEWRIALDLLDRSLPGLPHGWIVGDDEFGRAAEFRAALRQRPERYVLDVPCTTAVRDLERRRPRRRHAGRGRKREVPFPRADRWAASQPESRWERITVRGGAKGPLLVTARTSSSITAAVSSSAPMVP